MAGCVGSSLGGRLRQAVAQELEDHHVLAGVEVHQLDQQPPEAVGHAVNLLGERSEVTSILKLCFEELPRSEEHTSELQSLMRISYAVFCLKKKKTAENQKQTYISNS